MELYLLNMIAFTVCKYPRRVWLLRDTINDMNTWIIMFSRMIVYCLFLASGVIRAERHYLLIHQSRYVNNEWTHITNRIMPPHSREEIQSLILFWMLTFEAVITVDRKYNEHWLNLSFDWEHWVLMNSNEYIIIVIITILLSSVFTLAPR